eukprot:5130807-Pleurochrysis_carterae.AAC.1
MALADFASCSLHKTVGFGGKLVASPASGSVKLGAGFPRHILGKAPANRPSPSAPSSSDAE